MSEREAIKNLSPDELRAWLAEHGEPAFRLRQLHEWLYGKWAVDFAEMSSLSGRLREQLATAFTAFSLTLVETQVADDDTRKFLFRLADGESIETVLIRAPERLTVCVSTQVGCPVGCSFCASGRGGFVRNLRRGEIVDQIIHACREAGRKVTNVVVMGMGEPLLNLGDLLPALEAVGDSERLGLGARQITISTSGIPAGIRQLADCGRPWNLALSLHGTTDEQRARLIPPTHRARLAEILEACHYYRQQTKRMVTLEYALIAGSNDALQDAAAVAELARALRAKVNLIPCNPVGPGQRAPAGERVRAFLRELTGRGVQATIRQRKGDQIQAACGQLRRRAQEPADNR